MDLYDLVILVRFIFDVVQFVNLGLENPRGNLLFFFFYYLLITLCHMLSWGVINLLCVGLCLFCILFELGVDILSAMFYLVEKLEIS